jgi:hypothetical protein
MRRENLWDVSTGTDVQCADGDCGRAKYLIVDPDSRKVTHLVVGQPARLAKTRLVPLSYVAKSTPETIRLACTRDELELLPLFSESEHVGNVVASLPRAASELWMAALAAYRSAIGTEEQQHVPHGELSIRRGAPVMATDGPAGRVDELLVEPGSGHITHLVLRTGHPWGRRDIIIPAAAVGQIDKNTVFLKVNKERVNDWPDSRANSVDPDSESGPQVQEENDAEVVLASHLPDRSLLDALGSSDMERRGNARLALVSAGDAAIEALASALSSENPRTRWEAAKSLQQIHSPDTAPALVSALEAPDFSVRWIAADSLANLGRPGIVTLLRALTLRPGSVWLRAGAHHVLRSTIDANVRSKVEPVLAALEDAVPALEVPVAAREALTAIAEEH